MKLKGQTLLAPKPVELPFSRRDEDGQEIFITLTIKPILSFKPFEDKFPLPKPPVKKNGTVPYSDDSDPEYKQQVLDYVNLKMSWLLLEALKPSDIEWETVTADPTTWVNWNKEFIDSGFSPAETQMIEDTIYDISGLTAGNLEETRKRFLAWKREKAQAQENK